MLIILKLTGINTLYCKYDFVHGVDWTVIEVTKIMLYYKRNQNNKI